MAEFSRADEAFYSATSFWLESLFTEQPPQCHIFLQIPLTMEEDIYHSIIHYSRVQTRLHQYICQLHHIHAGPAFITHDLMTLPLVLWPGDTKETLVYFSQHQLENPHYECHPPKLSASASPHFPFLTTTLLQHDQLWPQMGLRLQKHHLFCWNYVLVAQTIILPPCSSTISVFQWHPSLHYPQQVGMGPNLEVYKTNPRPSIRSSIHIPPSACLSLHAMERWPHPRFMSPGLSLYSWSHISIIISWKVCTRLIPSN